MDGADHDYRINGSRLPIRCRGLERALRTGRGPPRDDGTDVVCGVSQCEQAWLFAGGYLVNVFGYLTGPGGIPMTSHGLPGVFPIGVDALAALTS